MLLIQYVRQADDVRSFLHTEPDLVFRKLDVARATGDLIPAIVGEEPVVRVLEDISHSDGDVDIL